MNSNHIIYICGNIGSGKTTILRELESRSKNNDNVEIIFEPLDVMIPLLEMKSKVYVEILQKYMLLHHFNIIRRLKNEENKLYIIETSPKDNYMFARLADLSYDFMDKYFEEYKELVDYRGKIVNTNHILLDCTVNICKDRIKYRGRRCENTIDYNYLISLNNELKAFEYLYTFENNNLEDMMKNAKYIATYINSILKIK